MMAIYTRNPYKLSSSDLKKGGGIFSASKREYKENKLYVAESHLKPNK